MPTPASSSLQPDTQRAPVCEASALGRAVFDCAGFTFAAARRYATRNWDHAEELVIGSSGHKQAHLSDHPSIPTHHPHPQAQHAACVVMRAARAHRGAASVCLSLLLPELSRACRGGHAVLCGRVCRHGRGTNLGLSAPSPISWALVYSPVDRHRKDPLRLPAAHYH